MDLEEHTLETAGDRCEECGANLNVTGVSPLELSPEKDDDDFDDDEDDDDLDDDEDEDDAEEEEDEDEDEWK